MSWSFPVIDCISLRRCLVVSPPLGYISVPRALPQLTHSSPASFAHRSSSPSPFLPRIAVTSPELVSIPTTTSVLSSSRAVHQSLLIHVVRPTTSSLAGVHPGRVPHARPSPPSLGRLFVRSTRASSLRSTTSTVLPSSPRASPTPQPSPECPAPTSTSTTGRPCLLSGPPLPRALHSSPAVAVPLNGCGVALRSRRCPRPGRGSPELAGPLAVSLLCFRSVPLGNEQERGEEEDDALPAGQEGPPSPTDPTHKKRIRPEGAFSFSSRGLFAGKKITDRSLIFYTS
nr:uncharacterized protein Rv2082-like [Aegilops tauschii subsp. strangulata]